MSETESAPRSFGDALKRLRHVQKTAKGGPPYSLFVNRPLGRVIAAAAYQANLTPNQVTYISAALTATGLIVLALAPASWLVGILVTVCLALGYAFDSADGQLARLRGGGSFAGEWLDHMIDSVKVAAIHVAVLISLYRNFDLHDAWLLVPLGFTVVSTVHFFGMILVDLMTRIQRATAGEPTPPPATAELDEDLAEAADGLRDPVPAVPAPRGTSAVLLGLRRTCGRDCGVHRAGRGEMASRRPRSGRAAHRPLVHARHSPDPTSR